MIKNINDLKKCQMVCREREDTKNCLNYLKQLGFDVEDFTDYYDGFNIVFWGKNSEKFVFSDILSENLQIQFYNKELVKTLQKFIKEKEEKEKEKEEVKTKDFEVAEDGRIIKVNNYESKEKVFIAREWDYREQTVFDTIEDFSHEFLDYLLKYGLAFSIQKARDKAVFKMETEIQLKNIAERLNKEQKIDWEDENQLKYSIYYGYDDKKLDWFVRRYRKDQGVIYCLDENFLNVAKKEIGEENLIKYFKEDFN
jgi:hypothetical protein